MSADIVTESPAENPSATDRIVPVTLAGLLMIFGVVIVTLEGFW